MNDRHVSSCHDFTSYILGELSEAEAAAFLDHAKSCQQCRSDLEDILPLSETLLTFEEDDAILLSSKLKQKTLDAAFAKRAPARLAPGLGADADLGTDYGASYGAGSGGHAGRSLVAYPVAQAVRASGADPVAQPGTRTRSQRTKRRLRVFRTASAFVAALVIGAFLGRWTAAPSAPAKSDAPATMLNEWSLTSATPATKSTGMAMVYQKGTDLSLIVYVKAMQPLDNYGCYSVWLKGRDGRQNVGDFTVDAQGDAVLLVPLSNLNAAKTLLITREPAWNDPAPQGPEVLTAKTGAVQAG